MRDEHVFVDTNILLYAHDIHAGRKKTLAEEKVAELWNRPYPPAISIQVLQEFFVNLLKLSVPLDNARALVENFMAWEVIKNDSALLLDAIDTLKRWHLSFWDSLIVAAAKRARATVIWSEDLQNGQEFGDVRVVNPLL